MTILRLLPVFISSLLIAAHFLRDGSIGWVVCSLGLPVVLFFRQRWTARLVQAGLLIAMMVWIRTLVILTAERMDMQRPWLRLMVILGAAAIWTGASACVFFAKPLKQRYRLTKTAEAPEC